LDFGGFWLVKSLSSIEGKKRRTKNFVLRSILVFGKVKMALKRNEEVKKTIPRWGGLQHLTDSATQFFFTFCFKSYAVNSFSVCAE
jgi:hypothetical protein